MSSLLRPTAKNTDVASGLLSLGGRFFVRLSEQSFPTVLLSWVIPFFILCCTALSHAAFLISPLVRRNLIHTAIAAVSLSSPKINMV